MNEDRDRDASHPDTGEPIMSASVVRSAASAPKSDAEPARRRVSMAVVNFWLDSVLLVLLVALGWVSTMLRVAFPAPTRAIGWTLWGWDYNQWSDVQFGVLCALGFGALIHVMLHWNWVCGVVANQLLKARGRVDDSMKTIYGVGLLIVLLHLIGAGVILAMWCVRAPRS
jgi:hypothetical protein